MSNTFLKTDRLNTAEEYSQVFKEADKFSDEFLTVLVSKKPLSSGKLGLAIAKKMVKKAVLRNQIKRIIREAFRLNKNKLKGFDMVVLCRKKAAQASKKELSASIKTHFDVIANNE
ncbi:MAG: ribonuclease P protein component [Piscirickettsiaceae bacterium]|nr:MAG: ribonuclease P protein component [Piscirickettsiaceae bacterium]